MNQVKKHISVNKTAAAVAMALSTIAAPVFATEDVKGILDLMRSKGVITQAEYDSYMNSDAAENQKFKEKRTSDDLSKAMTYIQKQGDAGKVQKSGLGIESADGAFSATLTGRIHMDYRTFDPNSLSGQGVEGFSMRRARMGIKGKMTKDFDYFVFGDFSSTSSAALDEGYITYIGNKAAQVRVGKFKMPFSLEQLTSSNNIDFMERSLIGNDDKELIPGKQYGAMLFGNPIGGASYSLAMSSGNFHRASDSPGRANNDLIARVAANLAELGGSKDVVTHVGAGFSHGTVDAPTFELGSATEGKGISKFIASRAAAVTQGANRTRYNLEGALAYGPFKLQGEMFDFGYEQNVNELNIKGNYLSALWNITGESHNYSGSSNTFGWIKPKESFSTAKGGLGAWQVGLRISEVESDGVVTASSTTKANATTLGLTWFANSNVRLMVNVVKTDFATRVNNTSSETAINARAQVSF
jgi:phosphate-selective porin OprO/OprP